jgi:hypothetical protein
MIKPHLQFGWPWNFKTYDRHMIELAGDAFELLIEFFSRCSKWQ